MAALIDLTTHEDGRKLDDVGGNIHVSHSLGGLQAQKATTNHSSALDVVFLGIGQHGLQVFNCAVNEDARTVPARDGRHEGERAGRQNCHVVRDLTSGGARDGLAFGVNCDGLITNVELHPILVIPGSAAVFVEIGRHGKVGRIQTLKVGGKLHAVVGRTRFFAECGHGASVLVEFEQVLHEPLTDHAVPYHHHALFLRLLFIISLNGIVLSDGGATKGRSSGELGWQECACRT